MTRARYSPRRTGPAALAHPAAAGLPGRPTAGFSLIELMIALVIVAILAAIAFPSYRQYVIRSHRGDATQALLRIAAEQEKYYIQNNSYADTLGAGGLNMDETSEHGWYDLSIVNGDANGFAAQAVVGADSTQAEDSACQTFGIDALGRKTAEDGGGNDNKDVCWR